MGLEQLWGYYPEASHAFLKSIAMDVPAFLGGVHGAGHLAHASEGLLCGGQFIGSAENVAQEAVTTRVRAAGGTVAAAMPPSVLALLSSIIVTAYPVTLALGLLASATLDNFVQLAAIEPHPSALWTVIDFYILTLAHDEICSANRAGETVTLYHLENLFIFRIQIRRSRRIIVRNFARTFELVPAARLLG